MRAQSRLGVARGCTQVVTWMLLGCSLVVTGGYQSGPAGGSAICCTPPHGHTQSHPVASSHSPRAAPQEARRSAAALLLHPRLETSVGAHGGRALLRQRHLHPVRTRGLFPLLSPPLPLPFTPHPPRSPPIARLRASSHPHARAPCSHLQLLTIIRTQSHSRRNQVAISRNQSHPSGGQVPIRHAAAAPGFLPGSLVSPPAMQVARACCAQCTTRAQISTAAS